MKNTKKEFSYSKHMTNFEAFCWNFSSSTNPFFLKRVALLSKVNSAKEINVVGNLVEKISYQPDDFIQVFRMDHSGIRTHYGQGAGANFTFSNGIANEFITSHYHHNYGNCISFDVSKLIDGGKFQTDISGESTKIAMTFKSQATNSSDPDTYLTTRLFLHNDTSNIGEFGKSLKGMAVTNELGDYEASISKRYSWQYNL